MWCPSFILATNGEAEVSPIRLLHCLAYRLAIRRFNDVVTTHIAEVIRIQLARSIASHYRENPGTSTRKFDESTSVLILFTFDFKLRIVSNAQV